MFNFLKKKPKIEKCSKCDKPVHKIVGWYGDPDLMEDKPLKSEFCIDHLIEESPKRFNDQIKYYADAVNKMQKEYADRIEKRKKELERPTKFVEKAQKKSDKKKAKK